MRGAIAAGSCQALSHEAIHAEVARRVVNERVKQDDDAVQC